MSFVHLFRQPDDKTHVVLTPTLRKVKRNGSHTTICGQLVEDTATRIVPHHNHLMAPVISCEICLDGTSD